MWSGRDVISEGIKKWRVSQHFFFKAAVVRLINKTEKSFKSFNI